MLKKYEIFNIKSIIARKSDQFYFIVISLLANPANE